LVDVADKEVAVPSFRRRASVIDADSVAPPRQQDADASADSADALSLAEEAEAEAAEAEAAAAAARARARAIRLRRQAKAAETSSPEGATEEKEPEEATGVVAPEADEAGGAEAGSAKPEVVDGVAQATVTEEAGADEAVEPADDEATTADEAELIEPAPKKSRRLRMPRIRWRRPRIRWGIVAAIVAILVISALVTLSVLMVLHHRQQAAEQQRTAEYSAAARQSVVTLMSLDFNKAQEDVQRIIDNSTGQFKQDFEAQAEDFAQVAKDSKVITEVNVNVAAVKSMTDANAAVLVSATSRVTNKAGAKQEPRSWRLLVDLVREGDQIKMSKVEFVP
jgi:Mce-associated membrane protein